MLLLLFYFLLACQIANDVYLSDEIYWLLMWKIR